MPDSSPRGRGGSGRHSGWDPRLVLLGGGLGVILLLLLSPGVAAVLAGLTLAVALARGGGARLASLALGIGILTVVLNALTAPGPALLALGPLAVSQAGIVAGLERAGRLVGLIALGSFLAHELEVEALADWAARAAWPLERRWPKAAGLGFAAGLSLRFLPEIRQEVARLRLAMAARPAISRAVTGGGLGFVRRWQRVVAGIEPLFLPLLAGAVRRAGEVGMTLDARGYGSGPQTPAPPRPLTAAERRLAGAMVMAAAAGLVVDRIAGRG